MPIESFIIKHKNIFVRENSRSGGIFTALTDIILDEKGIVYGVGAWQVGDIKSSPAMQEAYEMGRGVK